MREKFFGPVLGGALLLSATVGCCTDKFFEKNSKAVNYPTDDASSEGLESILNKVACVRSEQEFKGMYDAGSDAITDDIDTYQTKYSMGSTIPFYKKDGWTYFLTAKHVVDFDIYGVLSVFKIPILYVPSSAAQFNIVDNREDTDASDDTRLELFYQDPSLDIAVLRTRKEFPILDAPLIHKEAASVGDEVYAFGFMYGAQRVMSKGVVASNSENPVLNTWITPGFSGGPFFVRRGSRLLLGGVLTSVYGDESNRLSEFSRGVWLSDVYDKVVEKIGEEK